MSPEMQQELLHDMYQDAKETAQKTGKPEDVLKAGRVWGAYMDLFLPPEQRAPRDPLTFRLLTPSEMGIHYE